MKGLFILWIGERIYKSLLKNYNWHSIVARTRPLEE